jgi:Tol biopolymer transport system component
MSGSIGPRGRSGRSRWVVVGALLVIAVLLVRYGPVLARLPKALNSRIVSEVYLQTANGTRRISPAAGEGLFATPSISPTGAEAVFHGAVSGHSRIWRYTAADDKTAPLTDSSYVAVEPVYSWDGGLVAFAADKGIAQPRTDMAAIANSLFKMGEMYLGGAPKAMNIFVMAPDGSGLRRLTSWSAVDMRPTFSPDGRQVLFMSTHQSGSLKEPWLFTVPVSGGEAPRLVPNSAGANRPWYSADGAWIYFWKEIDGRGTLWRMRADGSECHPLSADAGGLGTHGAFIDPSGEWLWFHSVPDQYNQIFKMRLDGRDRISVTPAGFEHEHVGHVTAAVNGNYTFDVLRVLQKR